MSAVDRWDNRMGPRTDPPAHAYPITPDDDAETDFVTRAIVLGTEGAVRVLTLGGEDHTYPFLVAGMSHPMRIVKVFATGTTATGITGQD